MKEKIAKWVKQKQFKNILVNKTVRSMFYYEVYDFIGYDEEFYSLNVLYSETKILGTLNSLEYVKLKGDREEDINQDVNTVLDSMLRKFNGFEDWRKNKSVIIKPEEFKALVNEYLKSIVAGLYSISDNDGFVTYVEVISDRLPILLVKFSFLGEEQSLVLHVGEPSLVKRKCDIYNDFVEKLCQVTGGIVWH